MSKLNGFDRDVTADDRKHAKRYDAWFRSLPKVQQERLREEGAGPYCEAKVPDNVFPVYERSKAWSTDNQEQHTESESYVTREELGRVVADVVDMLGYTDDPAVRRHWELMRLVLRVPGHLNGKQIGELFGVTKQAISYLAKRMLARVDRRRRVSIDAQLDAVTQDDFGGCVENRGKPPVRESSKTPPQRRVAPTPRRFLTGVKSEKALFKGKRRK